MEAGRTLAAALAVNRTLFGVSYLAQPEKARTSWIGRVAKKPGAQVMIRSQGARDIALGAGALQAVVRGDGRDIRTWMLAHGVSDFADLVVTWLARESLPPRRAKLAMAIAAASTAVAIAGAATADGD